MKDNHTQEIPDRVSRGVIDDQVVLGEHGGFDIPSDPSRVPHIPLDHLIVVEMPDVFTLQGFERPRAPIVVGKGDLSSVPYPIDIHNLPIKFPNTRYRVPNELGCIADILATCVSTEESINPAHAEYYAYLSLERSWVDKGRAQRTPVIHSDGLQGPRVQPKVRTEHMYQVVDGYPPRFFVHPFDMTGIDVDVHDLDQVYTTQADDNATVACAPGDIALFDSYCLHQARTAPASGIRGFLRLTFADPRRQFNRQGNTINKLFEKEYATEGWEFQVRDKLALAAPPPNNLR